ncbi:MAG: UDP-N-acetylenolpyruvoylglucosamine reductase [Planctomycetaceae bacterium]|nr:MAG: UDP-N-acetylenolpyruvoylglucosamine reductase [Planctomycetaceae bacterium]
MGGPAQYLLTPRSVDELTRVVQVSCQEQLPIHVLGGGSNLLIRDEGVSGVVIQLSHPAFQEVHCEGNIVRAGGGALLSHVIAEAVRHGLAGLEVLAGIPGTVGGAVHGNAGGRHGDIGSLVRRLLVLSATGQQLVREGEQLVFAYRQSSLDELLILEAEFELRPDDPDKIAQRLRNIWVTKKATQPLSSQSAGCIFKNPRGQTAGELIEKAGLKGTRIGGAEVSERHANFIVTYPGATSQDVLRLIELMRSQVAEKFGVHLETEIVIW